MSDTFIVTDGYDRNKVKRRYVVRTMTLDEVKALQGGQQVKFLDNHGMLRDIRINGRVRTWKRDAERVEVPVKYGFREYATFDTAEALRRFVVVETYLGLDQIA